MYIYIITTQLQCWEDKEGRKKMNKTNAKSLSALKQKLRKYIKGFEKELEEYRESPDDPEDDLEAVDGKFECSDLDFRKLKICTSLLNL